jgi:hypothetical protein
VEQQFSYIYLRRTCFAVSPLRHKICVLYVRSYIHLKSVLRIRDVYPGSRIRLFSIPDPGSELTPSRMLIKEFKYFNPKKIKKMVSKLLKI